MWAPETKNLSLAQASRSQENRRAVPVAVSALRGDPEH
jgi:hypothetical protein